MQKTKSSSLSSKFTGKFTLFKILTPILLVVLLSAALVTPLYALTPARDLTGTWKNAIPEKYYVMDSFDPTMRMNDVSVTYTMIITQSGNSLSIVLNINELSSVTDPAYLNEYGYGGVPIVGFNQIGFTGTVSGASFSADEMGASTGNAEHIAGTFTTDIITATLTGPSETTDVNGIIVLRGGSSATMPPFVTVAPTATPTPEPAPPTASNVARVSQVQGNTYLVSTGTLVTTQTAIGAGSEVQTSSNGMIGFDYPDNGGKLVLGANSDAGWVYLKPQTDPVNGNVISYNVVSPSSGSYAFSEGIEPDEFGQAGLSLAVELGVGLGVLALTGAPITLGGALVVEGTLLLGSGIAYIHEQMYQQGTYDVRPIETPQGMVMGAGTDYVVTVANGATTIQVMDGSVIFIDQYTNSTVTIQANQMLTLPSGPQSGYSQTELQAHVTSFDSSSINQWWTQVAATPTATPGAVVTAPTATANPDKTSSNLLSSPVFLGGLLFVIIIVIAAVLATVRGRKHSKQPRVTQQKTGKQNTVQPTANETPKTSTPASVFCPNCGNQLLHTQGLCPFCKADLSQWYPNAKK